MMQKQKIKVMSDRILVPLHGRKKFYGWAIADLSDFAEISKTCWTLDARGYVTGRPPNAENCVPLHRFLMMGLSKGGLVDHRTGDKLDCRRSNLRMATRAGNAQNTRLAKNNSTGFKGIRLTSHGKWNARITVNHKEKHVGNYGTREEAAAAYDIAAMEYHGEFASTNESLDLKSC